MASFSKVLIEHPSRSLLSAGYRTPVVHQPVDKKYVCQCCGYLLRIPVQTGCGERFCRACSDVLLGQDNPVCPVCKEELSQKQVFRDMFAERETMALEVFCENQERECKWRGLLKDFDDHSVHCDHHLVPCPNGCGMLLVKKDIERHTAENCSQRMVQCTYCRASLSATQVDNHYANLCPNRPLVCSHCNDVTLPRDELKVHVDNDCPEVRICCKFAKYGCTYQFARCHEDEHNASHMSAHLSLVQESHSAQQQQVEQLSAQMTLVTRKLSDFERLVTDRIGFVSSGGVGMDMSSTVSDVSGHLRRHSAESPGTSGLLLPGGRTSTTATTSPMSPATSHTSMSVSQQVVQLNQSKLEDHDRQLAAIHQAISEHTKSLAVQDVQTADMNLRIDIIDVKTTNGVLVWKIGDVSRRRREAVSGRTPSLYSAPFYTSPAGYKMCIRIYLDGDGMGKGSSLSVFFVLMRGEYDALLQWPFQLRVTLMLMDQNESGTLRRNITEVFKPDRRSASFKRPTSEMNTGSGCPMFAPVNVLDSPTYVKDDTIFVKVIVERSSTAFTPPDSDRV